MYRNRLKKVLEPPLLLSLTRPSLHPPIIILPEIGSYNVSPDKIRPEGSNHRTKTSLSGYLYLQEITITDRL